jgi:hypothetical protein
MDLEMLKCSNLYNKARIWVCMYRTSSNRRVGRVRAHPRGTRACWSQTGRGASLLQVTGRPLLPHFQSLQHKTAITHLSRSSITRARGEFTAVFFCYGPAIVSRDSGGWVIGRRDERKIELLCSPLLPLFIFRAGVNSHGYISTHDYNLDWNYYTVGARMNKSRDFILRGWRNEMFPTL